MAAVAGSIPILGEATRSLAARTEPYALVREAALVALVELDAGSARALAQEIATKDAGPRVRETAAKIAKGVASPRSVLAYESR